MNAALWLFFFAQDGDAAVIEDGPTPISLRARHAPRVARRAVLAVAVFRVAVHSTTVERRASLTEGE